jgi:hypothetical protein
MHQLHVLCRSTGEEGGAEKTVLTLGLEQPIDLSRGEAREELLGQGVLWQSALIDDEDE